MAFSFPKGFFFGAATSAHQVEGGTVNDWSEWEIKNSKISAKGGSASGGKNQKSKLLNWPDYLLKNYPNPIQEENYISGRAADHYNRFEKDFDLAKKLGQNAHRFSIEWSRIEPLEGVWSEKEIEHYRNVIRALRKRNLEPFLTIWHWTLPAWLVRKGGVLCSEFPEHFSQYAAKLVSEFGDDVRFWITLNETNVYTAHGYWKGVWPPGERSLFRYLRANHHLSRAHRAAYAVMKRVKPEAQIGVAHNAIWFTKGIAQLKRFVWNHLFLRSIRRYQDFVGINYYHSDRDTKEHSEFLNWPIDPDGLYAVIQEMKRYGMPIYVTENGIADARDVRRGKFIEDHLRSIARAIQEGAAVRGYFHWSLLDNFEWDKGFWPRFGLLEVDYRTFERKIRPSALAYKSFIEHGLP